MPATLIGTPATFSFADGNTGHVCNLGSAPTVGQLDVLGVNSDTTVSTPSGFTLPPNGGPVANQGAYIFYRKAVGGETGSVTVTTAGNFNTEVSWSRWGNVNAFDVAAATQVNGAVGGATPAHSTGALTETNELVIALGALHRIQTANQNTPVWSGGFTGLTAALQGAGDSGVVGYVGYRTDAGTPAVSPQVSWSGDGAFDRYMVTAAFTAAGPPVVAIVGRGAVTLVDRSTVTAPNRSRVDTRNRSGVNL